MDCRRPRWLTLARHPVVVRGKHPDPAIDPARLRRWNLDNLAAYWRPLAGQIRHAVAERPANAPANAVGVVWAVLGPARPHYTLATGDVTSKSGAGRYAIMRSFRGSASSRATISKPFSRSSPRRCGPRR